jgi:hypothetical protein
MAASGKGGIGWSIAGCLLAVFGLMAMVAIRNPIIGLIIVAIGMAYITFGTVAVRKPAPPDDDPWAQPPSEGGSEGHLADHHEPQKPPLFGCAALVLFALACVTPFLAYAWSESQAAELRRQRQIAIGATIAGLIVGVGITVGSVAGAMISSFIGVTRGERRPWAVRWFPLIWVWVMLVFMILVVKK